MMKIVTIEPTPSPNSMKIVVNEELPFGKSFNYTKDNANTAPEAIQSILNVEGVKGVYHVAVKYLSMYKCLEAYLFK